MSRWLAGHSSDEELLGAVEREDRPEARELRDALEQGAPRTDIDRLVRETLQDVAAG